MRLRRNQRAEVLELVRSELHVELARAVAQSADRVRVDLAREADVAGAIDRLTEVCERLVERIDQDRAERRALAEAIAGLAPPRPRGSAVIGGSIGGRLERPDELVLDDPAFDDLGSDDPRPANDPEAADPDVDLTVGRRPFDWGG
jgi:hypothetical protein